MAIPVTTPAAADGLRLRDSSSTATVPRNERPSIHRQRARGLRTFISRSCRWAEAPIDEEAAATMTPETAPEFIHAAESHVFGGSYHGHAGKRGKGRRH